MIIESIREWLESLLKTRISPELMLTQSSDTFFEISIPDSPIKLRIKGLIPEFYALGPQKIACNKIEYYFKNHFSINYS